MAPRTRLRERTLPGNPASAVYGTIVTAGQLAVESATGPSSGRIVASLAATLVVFWLAHSYTDTLGTAITADGTPPSVRHALRTEWPIVESGLIPAAVVLLAAAFGAAPGTAAAIALVVAAVELVGWAALAGRRAHVSGARLLLFTGVAGLFGIALIGLKYAIH